MIKWNEYTWYSKLLAAIFFILVLPALTFYIGTQYQKTYELAHMPPPQPEVKNIPTPSTENKEVYPLSESEKTAVLSELEAAFGQSEPIIYTDRSGQFRISFVGEVMEQTRNPGAYVYFDGVQIGRTDGMGIISTHFSPDNRYFSFKTLSVCGAVCRQQDISIVDLQQQNLIAVARPPEEGNDGLGFESNLVIEDYDWGSGGVLNMTTFLTIDRSSSETMRSSPKHLWRYDLLPGRYTLVQTLPER